MPKKEVKDKEVDIREKTDKPDQMFKIKMQYIREKYCPTEIEAIVPYSNVLDVHASMCEFIVDMKRIAPSLLPVEEEEKPTYAKATPTKENIVKEVIKKEPMPDKPLTTAKDLNDISELEYKAAKKVLARLEKVKEVDMDYLSEFVLEMFKAIDKDFKEFQEGNLDGNHTRIYTIQLEGTQDETVC